MQTKRKKIYSNRFEEISTDFNKFENGLRNIYIFKLIRLNSF